jgi:hypothetical protein
MRQRRREGTANDPSSPKAYRHEGHLAAVRIQSEIFTLLRSLHSCRVVLLLLRRRRGAAGDGLGTTAKYLRRATSGAAGFDLGIAIKYLRRTL